MRFSSYALPALAANLVAALPTPQEIDLDMVLAAPDPTYTEAVGVTAQTITFNSAAIVAEATATISSVSVDAGDVLSSTAVAHDKRAAATCVRQPTGASSAPTYAADQDDAGTFAANTYYASVASAAPTPTGYTQSFLNKQASNNAFAYMGFDTMDTYDVNTCAQRCTDKQGCVSINIYFERDPSVDPNDASCLNPPSVTMIKCVYWGGPATADNAVNKGQMRGNFDVRIAGSNGYITTQLSTPAGFQDAVPYGKFAINAPYDAQGYNTFMGSKIFTKGTWNVNLCSDYCNSQTAYNKATAPKDGTPYKVCNFFNTYILTAKKADGTIVPQGQYCSLYTEAWPIKYATNGGQWRGQDQYTVDYSFGYKQTAASIDPLVGDSNGAAYQAVADIKWSSLQPFCSAYLGYSIPVSTVTSVATTIPVVTSTSYSTTTVSPKNDKRALSIPADLSKYPATVVSSACSMQATKPSSTSTTTAFSTFTAAASTSVVSVVSTTTAAPAPTTTSFKLATSNGNLIGTETSDTDGTETNTADIIYAFQPATTGSVFTLNYQTGELTVAYGGSQYSLLEAWWENGIFPLAKFSNAPGSHAKSSCSLTSSQGLYCGDNYFSICPNDINLHYANYVPSSSCVKNVLVAVPLV